MPRIRKKTSKRGTTHQGRKIKEKAREARRKKTRDAKRDPTWKSKNKKKEDLGIPNSAPFKEQVLAEIEAGRRAAEEAKLARREAKRREREGLPAAEQLVEDEEAQGMDEDDEEAPTLVNNALAAPAPADLGAALDGADVVLEVLDARDPIGFRVEALEKVQEEGKKVVLVLNKADLVPRETISAWLAHFRPHFPTFLFSSQPPAPAGAETSSAAKQDPLGAAALKELLLEWAKEKKGDASLSVVVAGLPNVGKSALLNSLLPSPFFRVASANPSAATAKTPTTTTVRLSAARLSLASSDDAPEAIVVDTPGVSFTSPSADPTGDMLRRNLGKVERIKEPMAAAEWIMRRSNEEDLMLHYNLPAFSKGDFDAFLSGIARSTGRVKKGGVIDSVGAARHLIQSFSRSTLPYYTLPPTPSTTPSTSAAAAAATILPTPAASVAAADADLARLPTRREVRRREGGEVRMHTPPADAPFEGRELIRTVGGEIVAGPSYDEEEQDPDLLGVIGDREELDEELDEDEEDEEDEDDDEEDDEEEDEETPAPPPSRKRKGAPTAASAASVKFAQKHAGPSRRAASAAASVGGTPKSILKSGAATPTPTKRAKVEKAAKSNDIKARPGLKAKKAAGVEGEAYDFNSYF